MAIDAQKLKGDLAIEIDVDSVAAGDFHGALESFLTLIRELTRQIHSSVPKDCWLLSVQEGSQVVSVRPDHSRLPPAVAMVIETALLDGMRDLEREAKAPRYFTEKALESARDLSRIAFGKRDVGIPVRVLNKNYAHVVTRNIYNHVSELLDWKYEDLGTIEGTLEVVSAHNGYEIRVYEPVWLRPVRCTFGEDLLEDALKHFKRRVEVEGLIRYTKDGLPVSARVVKIGALPDPSELPSWREVKGILRN